MSWRSSHLKIHRGEGNSANSFFVVVIYPSQVWEFLFPYYSFNLLSRFLVREEGAFSAQVSYFSTAETQSFFDTSFSLFWGKLSDMDDIDIHCIRVFGSRGGGGERLVRVLGGVLVPF